MKRVIAGCSFLCFVSLGVFLTVGAAEFLEGSNSAAPGVSKVARYGNADSISEEEMTIFWPPTSSKDEISPPAVTTPQRSTSRVTWRSGV